MEKTAKQIELDIYRIIKNSDLGTAINGNIYRSGMRPTGATTEDAVVKFLTGIDEQEQSGVVIVNIYVPDTMLYGDFVEDVSRVDELEDMVNEVMSSLEDTEYWIEKDGTPHSFPAEGVKQHFINVRLRYRRKTF